MYEQAVDFVYSFREGFDVSEPTASWGVLYIKDFSDMPQHMLLEGVEVWWPVWVVEEDLHRTQSWSQISDIKKC